MENVTLKRKLIMLGEELSKHGYTYILGIKGDEPRVSYTINGKSKTVSTILLSMMRNNPILVHAVRKALETYDRNFMSTVIQERRAN
ncbi:MAG: hypothetical protein LUC88_04515 [Prevotella sp.]|nr:hypothetical protein [Prevotella sp.]